MPSVSVAEESLADQQTSFWFTTGRFSAILALAILGVFPKVVLGLETFFYRDFGVLAYPTIYYYHESFWRGELPLWNPLSNCGAPFLAQWGTMVLYPFSLFYLLLPLPWSLNFFCLAHLFWAGLGTYKLALRWTGNRFAATVAGFAFVFNGVTFSCLLWPNYLVALGWMPWVVWIVERSWHEGKRWLIGAALISALQVLSGVPEVVMLTWLLLFVVWVVACFDRSASRRVLIFRVAAIILLVAGLTAAQLLPFWELLQHSQRDRSFATAKWSMPLSGLANLLVPLFHCFQTPQGIFFQIGQQFMSSTYLGISVLALALYASLFVRNKTVWLLTAFAFFSFFFAVGENGILYRAVKQFFPLVGFARYPIKFIILAAFVLPLLAACAIAELETHSAQHERYGPRRVRLIWLILVILSVTILTWARLNPLPSEQWSVLLRSGCSRMLLLSLVLALLLWRNVPARLGLCVPQILVVTIIVFDTLSHTPRQNPTLPLNVMAPGLWEAAHHLRPPKPGESRVMITPLAEEVLLKSGVQEFSADLLGKRLALWSHLNLIEGIAKVNGSSTLQIRQQAQVQSMLYAATNTHLPTLLDFLGAEYVSSETNVVAWVRRGNQLPIITVGQQPIFADAAQTTTALMNPNFDPRGVVYLPVEAGSVVSATNAPLARIIAVRFSAQWIEIDTESPQPAMVVIAQSFYPAWRARVDGVATRLWPANHAFQAVEIPAGQHRLVLEYQDRSFTSGMMISVAVGILCLALWGYLGHRERKRAEGTNFPQLVCDSKK